jgi:hypothetical protein
MKKIGSYYITVATHYYNTLFQWLKEAGLSDLASALWSFIETAIMSPPVNQEKTKKKVPPRYPAQEFGLLGLRSGPTRLRSLSLGLWCVAFVLHHQSRHCHVILRVDSLPPYVGLLNPACEGDEGEGDREMTGKWRWEPPLTSWLGLGSRGGCALRSVGWGR